MDYPKTIDVEELAKILHKTPGAILVDRTHPRRKTLIPPALKNTGSKKLLWSLETVSKWLKENEEPCPTKDFLTLSEVAVELSCAVRTLQNQRNNLPFPTTILFGKVAVPKKHFEQYKKNVVLEAERNFEMKKEGDRGLKRRRGRPKKLPDFCGMGSGQNG